MRAVDLCALKCCDKKMKTKNEKKAHIREDFPLSLIHVGVCVCIRNVVLLGWTCVSDICGIIVGEVKFQAYNYNGPWAPSSLKKLHFVRPKKKRNFSLSNDKIFYAVK